MEKTKETNNELQFFKKYCLDLETENKILTMKIKHLEWVIENEKLNKEYLNIKKITDEKILKEMNKKDLINKIVDLEIKVQNLELDNRDLIFENKYKESKV